MSDTKSRPPRARRDRPSRRRTLSDGGPVSNREPDSNRLGEARQAVDALLASWALRELVAQRTSKVARG